jgi:hypothetical protein
LIAKEVNVGVALLVYGRDDGVARRITDVQTQWTGCGPAWMGNKGAVGVRFRVPGDNDEPGETFTYVQLIIAFPPLALKAVQIRLCTSRCACLQSATTRSGY